MTVGLVSMTRMEERSVRLGIQVQKRLLIAGPARLRIVGDAGAKLSPDRLLNAADHIMIGGNANLLTLVEG